MLGAKNEQKSSGGDLNISQRKLGDRILFIFHFDWDIIRGEKLVSKVEDARELGGIKPVIRVVSHEDLQQAGGKRP